MQRGPRHLQIEIHDEINVQGSLKYSRNLATQFKNLTHYN